MNIMLAEPVGVPALDVILPLEVVTKNERR